MHLAVIFFLVNGIVEFEEWLTASFIRVGGFRRGVKTLLWITEQIAKSLSFNEGMHEANHERFELSHSMYHRIVEFLIVFQPD